MGFMRNERPSPLVRQSQSQPPTPRNVLIPSAILLALNNSPVLPSSLKTLPLPWPPSTVWCFRLWSQMWSANAGGVRDAGSIPGLEISLGGGNGSPLHYSCLENPMDREAWWAAVTKSWGHKELNTTECAQTHARTHAHTHTHWKFPKFFFAHNIFM